MSLKCLIGAHTWQGCKCAACDKVRDEAHDWSKDCERCATCGQTQAGVHVWKGCKCSQCKTIRDQDHDWSKNCCKCLVCAKSREGSHAWNGDSCTRCGASRDLDPLYEINFAKLRWKRATDRISAVEQLSGYCTPRSISTLLQHQDTDYRVRDAVAVALKHIGEHGQWDELIAVFNQGGGGAQAYVVASLGRRRDERSPALLMSAMTNRDARVRLAAIDILGDADDPRAVPAVISAIKDTSEVIRALAFKKLVRIPGAIHTQELIEGIHDSHVAVRVAAARAVPVVRPPNAFELLTPMLVDSDVEVRIAAVEGLGTLKDGRAVAFLVAASCQGNERCLNAVVHSLEQLSGRTTPEMLMDAIRANSPLQPRVGYWLANELKAHGDIGALACLLVHSPLSQVASGYLHELVTSENVPALYPFLKQGNSNVQVSIIELLALIKAESSLSPLIEVLSYPDPSVRAASVTALSAIGGPRAEEAIMSLSGDERYLVRLACIKALRNVKSGVELLIRWLGDERPELRLAVVESLEVHDDPDAVNALTAALVDFSKDIRAAAASALSRSSRDKAAKAQAAPSAPSSAQSQPEMSVALLDQAIEILHRLSLNGYTTLRYNLAKAIWRKASVVKESGNLSEAVLCFDQAAALLGEGAPLSIDLATVHRERALCLGEIGDKSAALAAYEAARAIKRGLSRWRLEQDIAFYERLVSAAGKADFRDCLARALIQQAVTLYQAGHSSCRKCGGRGIYGGGTLTGGRHYDLPCSSCSGRGIVDARPEARQVMDRALGTYDQLVSCEGRHDLLEEFNEFREMRAGMAT